MQGSASWLTKLKATELHRLAILVGTPCSGTKAVVTRGIQDALSGLPDRSRPMPDQEAPHRPGYRVLSIDMGIRNLAYSFWTLPTRSTASGNGGRGALPTLRAWEKLNVSASNSLQHKSLGAQEMLQEMGNSEPPPKESFEPLDYADRAYVLIKRLLDAHDPSHILIERQRFRSGGHASVQEWTIRVGVFEGMLYAVLRSLAASCKNGGRYIVEPVLPARVNKYWFRETADSSVGRVATKSHLTSRALKKAKIELVQQHLRVAMGESGEKMFEIDEDVLPLARAFTTKPMSDKGTRKSKSTKTTEQQEMSSNISKLDDLADSLLQGLAWIHWQHNRIELQTFKEKAFQPKGSV